MYLLDASVDDVDRRRELQVSRQQVRLRVVDLEKHRIIFLETKCYL